MIFPLFYLIIKFNNDSDTERHIIIYYFFC